jgi:hypothetical protein
MLWLSVKERFPAMQIDVQISIIVPVYREEGNIDEFLRRITPILAKLTDAFEIIFALDPSPDQTTHDPSLLKWKIQLIIEAFGWSERDW